MNRQVLILACAVVVIGGAGCLSPYHPYSSSTGYSETPVAGGQYEVLFVGTRAMNPTQVKYFCTVRAAELTQAHGYSHFELITIDESLWEREEVVAGRTTLTREETVERETDGGRTTAERAELEELPSQVVVHRIPVCRMTIDLLAVPTASSFEASGIVTGALLEARSDVSPYLSHDSFMQEAG